MELQTILTWTGIGVVVAAVIGYNYYTKKSRSDQSWRGVVIDKNIQEHVQRSDHRTARRSDNFQVNVGGVSLGRRENEGTMAVTHQYSIRLRLDGTNEELNWKVSNGFYEEVSIGDTLSKPAGTLTPQIEQRAASAATAPVQPPVQPPQQ